MCVCICASVTQDSSPGKGWPSTSSRNSSQHENRTRRHNWFFFGEEKLFAKGLLLKIELKIKQPKFNLVTIGRDSSFPCKCAVRESVHTHYHLSFHTCDVTHSYMSYDTCIHGTWCTPHPFSGNITFPSLPLCVCLTDTRKQPVYRCLYVCVYMCYVKERPPTQPHPPPLLISDT